MSLLPNPSHLEAINPVIVGKARARQLSLREGQYHYGEGEGEGERDGNKVCVSKCTSCIHTSHLEISVLTHTDTHTCTHKHTHTLSLSLSSQQVLSIQIHGDAAFSAQGVVMETLGMTSLPYFGVGGALHLVVNNQLGFTAPRDHGRLIHQSPQPTYIVPLYIHVLDL